MRVGQVVLGYDMTFGGGFLMKHEDFDFETSCISTNGSKNIHFNGRKKKRQENKRTSVAFQKL